MAFLSVCDFFAAMYFFFLSTSIFYSMMKNVARNYLETSARVHACIKRRPTAGSYSLSTLAAVCSSLLKRSLQLLFTDSTDFFGLPRPLQF